jgi:transcriptional regulator GlxA family with amidase domain
MSKNRVLFLILDNLHLLDLAGPVQAFYEANTYGIPYEILYLSDKAERQSSSQLKFHQLTLLSKIKLEKNDIIVVAGYHLLPTQNNTAINTFLQKANNLSLTICSICTGAFALAAAGILNNKVCTTHWKYTDQFQKEFPNIIVTKNRLFVKDGNVYTSAGIATGIDLALFVLEERHGAEFAWKVAREMVVYIRRDGEEAQESIYLQYRRHINSNIHDVQDYIIHHLNEKLTIELLAEKIFTSPRNLTRLFKSTTSITVGEYIEKMRIEKAKQLIKAKYKMEAVAAECGFKSTTQLKTILRKQ